MKKLFAYIFIIAFIFSALMPRVFAQTTPATTNPDEASRAKATEVYNRVYTDYKNRGSNDISAKTEAWSATVVELKKPENGGLSETRARDFAKMAEGEYERSNPTATPTNAKPSTGDGTCSDVTWYNPLSWIMCAIDKIVFLIGYMILSLVSWVLWLAGALLNITIKFTVISMKANIDQISAIAWGWKIFRDLANMAFIFILLYISIETIIKGSGINTKELLAKVVIVAVLVNFSLFFTKLIIDTSNIVTIGFYNKLTAANASAGASSASTPTTDTTGQYMQTINSVDGGISSAIMQNLKLSTLYSISAAGGKTPDRTTTYIRFWTIVIFGSIMLLTTAYVFFHVTYLFILRFIVLIFLMILAPLAFVAHILPQTQKYSKQWWEALFEQSIFAPVFFIIIWFAIEAMKSLSNAGVSNNATFVSAFEGQPGSIGLILNFIILIAFIYAALSFSKKIAGQSSGMAREFVSKAMGTVGKYGGSLVARNTVGRYAEKVDDRLSKVSNKSFAGKLVGNSALGRTVRSSTVGALTKEKFGGSKSYEDVQKEGKEIAAKQKSIDDTTKLRNAAARAKTATVGSPEHKQAVRDIDESLKKMTDNEVSKLDKSLLKEPAVAQRLTQSHLTAIGKNEKISDEDQVTIRAQKLKPLREAVASNDDAKIKMALGQLTDSEVANLPADMHDNPTLLKNLKGGQLAAIAGNKDLTKSRKDEIKELKLKPLNDALTAGNGAEIDRLLTDMSNEEIGNLPGNTLINPLVVERLTPRRLEAIAKADKINDPQAQTIKNLIRGGGFHQSLNYINNAPHGSYWFS